MTGIYSAAQPVKRHRRFYVIIIAVVVLALVLVMALSYMIYENTRTGPGPVTIEVTTDKPFYLQGESVTFSVYVNNQQNWRVPYPSEVSYGVGNESMSVNIDYGNYRPSFPASSKTFYNTYVWSLKSIRDQTSMPPGNYTFKFFFDGPVDYGDGGSCIVEVYPKPQS